MTIPVTLRGRLSLQSRLPFHWRAHRFSLTALSGQAATFARAGTQSTPDVNGTSRTVVHSQPAWAMVDTNEDAVRDTPALDLNTSSTVYWYYYVVPQALTVYLEFVQDGAMGAASKTLFYIGNAGNTGARLWIDSTGTYYRANHHNGTSSVTSTLAAAPSDGQRVALRMTLKSDGKIQLHQSIAGAAESSASESGTLTLGAAWSDTRIYLNSTGSTNNADVMVYACRVAHGGAYAATAMSAMW